MRGTACLVALALCLTGCWRDVTYKYPSEQRDADADAKAPKLADIDKARWAEMNAFALRATRAAAQQTKGNLAFCPVGLWSAGAVLLNASNGDANAASLTLLGLKEAQLDEVNSAQWAWHTSLPEDGPFKQGLGVFMIWPILVTHEFQDSMARDYRADVLKIGSAGEGARNAINAWAKKRTGGMVPTAVGPLTKDTVFIISHVAGFASRWQSAFDQHATSDGEFTTDDGRKSTANFMRRLGPLAVIEDPTWRGCIVPFDDPRYAFVALMPKAGPLDKALAEATALPAPMGSEMSVELVFPRFKTNSETDLLPIISRLGGGKLLTPPNDLRRMSIELDNDAYVGTAKQTVTVEASEDGFVASSATELGVAAADRPEAEAMVFDRPFLWGVVDTATGVYVFTGVVRDPSAR